MNEFRATLCFGCRHRGEAEGFSRCFHPLATKEQIARLSGEVGPLRIATTGPYAANFSQSFPDGFKEICVDHCEGRDILKAVNEA